MPRDHARFQTAIWRNTEFRKLPSAAQHMYFTVTSQDALSYAGLLDYRPGRIAALAEDLTPRKVEAAVKVLEHARFVIVDTGTEELLVRTYVRHDGILDRVNMGKALGRALVKVVSTPLRQALLSELARLYEERPDAPGWIGLDAMCPKEFTEVTALSSTIPFPITSRK